MFSKGSARPPRSLVALIIGITVVPLATLLWLGWRLLEQDRALEQQQVTQRVDRPVARRPRHRDEWSRWEGSRRDLSHRCDNRGDFADCACRSIDQGARSRLVV
jgi:hypothetical protein